LSEEESDLIVEHYETIKPYLSKKSITYIEKNGKYEYSKEFGWVTPTLPSDNEICAYAIREKNGLIKCAFEQAYNDGKINWKKPVSCHLYPIIAYRGKHGDYERLNYEPRKITCSPACKLGNQLKTPVYVFLKEPLIRKYGTEFYEMLEAIVDHEVKSEN
jgi:hypothetical protein